MQSPVEDFDDKTLPKRPKEPLGSNFMSPLLALVALGFACLVVVRFEPLSFGEDKIAYSGLSPELQHRVHVLNQTIKELHHDLSVYEYERDGVSTGAMTIDSESVVASNESPSGEELIELTHSLKALSQKLDSIKKEALRKH